MEVLGDLVVRGRRSDATALRVPSAGRSYDYRRFCTSAWKVGNFLRHHGVRAGAGVSIADDPLPEAVLTLYGAACLGAMVRFDPATVPADGTRALVVPEPALDRYDPAPSTKRIVYGDRHTDPSVAYFERDVWSENPTAPPDTVDPADPLLDTESGRYSHATILEAAETIVARYGLEADTTVAVSPDASLAEAGTVIGGLVAPILAGGTVEIGRDAAADLTVGGSSADVTPAAVLGET